MAVCGAEDDWLIDSFQKYGNLHMFELQYPTKCMEWAHNGTVICMAGYSTEHPNEIVQLALPEKLLPQHQQSLCARRDLKILRGGFSKTPITSIKYIHTEDLMASAGYDTSVSLWGADNTATDMLTKITEIPLKVPSTPQPTSHRPLLLDWTLALPAGLLLGMSLQSVQLVDLHTHNVLFECGNTGPMSPLHGLSFAGQGSSVFVTCSGDTGQLDIWDMRTTEGGVVREGGGGGRGGGRGEGRKPTDPELFQTYKLQDMKTDFRTEAKKIARTFKDSQNTDSSYTEVVDPPETMGKVGFALAVSSEAYPDSRLAVCGADSLALYETRDLRRPFMECRVTSSSSDVVLRNRFTRSQESLCIKFCPENSYRLSLSGLTRGVAVYDTSQWTNYMEVPPPPLFTHMGHEEEIPGAQILVHSWHPHLHNMILSIDTEGSLHAWQWEEESHEHHPL